MFDARQNVQYGWSAGSPRNSDMVELPMAPIRRRPAGGGCDGSMNWHTFGIFLSLLSAASLALGVADVVITYKTYMEGLNCKEYVTPSYCSDNNLVWTWVAVGIWGSLPVFIFGIFCIYKGSRPMVQVNYFDLFAFFCAVIFTPAIIVLSAIEVYKGSNVYYWTAPNLENDDLVKAIIPIVISGLGLIEFIMCMVALFNLCCSNSAHPVEYMYGSSGSGGSMDKIVPTKVDMYRSPYPQGTYDRPYNTQLQLNNQGCRSGCGGGQSSSFYAAQAPSPIRSSYNQFNTGPMCNGSRCSPNPAYNYFRS